MSVKPLLPVSVISAITKLLKEEVTKMSQKKQQKRSVKAFSRLIGIFPILFFIVHSAGLSALMLTYFFTGNSLFFYITIAYGLLMAAAYVAFTVLTAKKFDNIFISGLFGTTLYNFKNVTDNDNKLKDYPGDSYREFNELNDEIDTLRK